MQDQINGIKIRADRHDDNDVDFVSGINNTMAKDGQNSATADLNMGGNKLKNGKTATLVGDFPIVSDIQNAVHTYVTSTGSANAYVVTLATTPAGLVAGQPVSFKANFLSTGNVTLDVNALGAKSVLLEGFFELAPYAIKTNQVVTVVYDGTQYQPYSMNAVTGDIQMWSSTTIKPGWLQLNGSTTIGSAASAADDNANVNEGLWKHLYDATDDAEAAVSSGRTTRDADWTSDKTLTLPETDDAGAFGIGSTLTKAFKSSGASTVVSTGSISGNVSSHILTEAELPTNITLTVPTGDVNDAGTSRLAKGINSPDTTSIAMTNVGSGSGHSHANTFAYSGNATSVLQPVFGTFFIIKI